MADYFHKTDNIVGMPEEIDGFDYPNQFAVKWWVTIEKIAFI